MKFKRILSLFLVLALLLTLTGCGNATKSSDGSSITTTDASPSAEQQLVDEVFRLGSGESLPDDVTLTGRVSHVKEISEGYGNATFDLQVQGSDGPKTIYCYRVKPAEGVPLQVAVGDEITLTGTIQNYKGTIEFYPATFSAGDVPATTTTPRPTGDGTMDEDGVYETKEDVALYLHIYGRLPKNFVTKSEFSALGQPWDKCCGGDRFYNKEGLLPNKAGRLYYECDIDTLGASSRGQKRIVYSNDGLIYYTGDHYRSFTLLYGEP